MTRFGEISSLWKKFTSLWNNLMVYFLFGKMLSLLWQICEIIGLIFIVVNGQILKNNPTIWSHCSGRLDLSISSKNYFIKYLKMWKISGNRLNTGCLLRYFGNLSNFVSLYILALKMLKVFVTATLGTIMLQTKPALKDDPTWDENWWDEAINTLGRPPR